MPHGIVPHIIRCHSFQHLRVRSFGRIQKRLVVTHFSDYWFSMERQIQKRIYNHKNTRCHTIMNEGQEAGNNVIC